MYLLSEDGQAISRIDRVHLAEGKVVQIICASGYQECCRCESTEAAEKLIEAIFGKIRDGEHAVRLSDLVERTNVA